jgi:hypothetical protein
MPFTKWPTFLVLPANEDFQQGEWESECGTRGCAFGWLCTAFGVELPRRPRLENLPIVPKGSPAAAFARALIAELPEAEENGCRCSECRAFRKANPVALELSNAFENADSDTDFAGVWERAAKKRGYQPAGKF